MTLEYEEQGTKIAKPERPEQTMQIRAIKMAVMPKGEPIFSERATMIEIDDEAAGEFLVISQDHNLPDYSGKIVINPEEWPSIKSAIETMIGYIEEAEKEDKQ